LFNSRYVLVFFSLIVTMVGIHNSSHLAVAGSDWDARAEAQFEFSKFIKKFQSALETENPQTITNYKKVIFQLIPEYRQTIDRLDPLVKLEFCKIARTSPEYPVDCSVLNEPLPLPTSVPEMTSLSNSINNSSGPCFSPEENDNLTTLEISTLQMKCNSDKDLNITNSEVSTLPEPYNETNTERAKERLVVGCESLKLLSNETQIMLRNMNNNIAKCYKDAK
jgi:hypothetical protein